MIGNFSFIQKALHNSPQNNGSSTFISRFICALIRIVTITFREFGKNALSLRAGALTYTILLSLVPMLAMSTAVVKGLGGGDQLRDVAYSYIQTLESTSTSPLSTDDGESSKLTGHLRSAIDQVFNYVDKTNFATLGSFGVAGILVSVLLVLGNIETAMNAIWKVDTSRSLMRKISDYLTLLFLVPLSINIAFAGSAFLKNPALQTKMDILIPFPFIQALLFKFIPIFFIALTLYVIYLFFPNTKVRSIPAVIGAAVAGTIWFAVQNIYISLQVGVANYNAIYGSFATFPLFLVWIYLGWMFILSGAQLTYALQNRNSYAFSHDRANASLRLSLAFDIADAVHNGYSHEQKVTADSLHKELASYPTGLIDETIATMEEKSLIYTVDKKRIVPAAPEQNLNDKRIARALLGEEFTETIGGQKSKNFLGQGDIP